jgi:hypothetical protein
MKVKSLLLLNLVLGLNLALTADLDDGVISITEADKIQEIKSMDYKELITRKAELEEERNYILNNLDADDSQSQLAKISAELSAIQKAIIAILGVGAISALSDDGYDDNVPPVITVIGSNPATVELGDTYTDQGATAFDEFHGETPVSSSGTVDTSNVGTYTITYTATDLDGNTATASRTVNVVDTTAPVVTVTGDNPATAELGSTYTDAGATATDASGTVTVTSSGTVDTSTVGTYTISYSASDASGNTGTASRTVNVVDTTAPVFTSAATFIVEENQTAIGTVTATDITAVTFTISNTDAITITAQGVLSFITAIDYESKPGFNGGLDGYDNSTFDFTATVTATDANSNTTTQEITVKVQDVGGIDDNEETGTGTQSGTTTVVSDTDTATATDTSTGTGTDTSTGTGTDTSTGTGTGTGTGTDTSTGTGTGT